MARFDLRLDEGGSEKTGDRLIALGLFIGTFVVLLLTEKAVGFVRDESVYFVAGERYARWLELLFRSPLLAVRDESIARAFQYNSEHPALMKLLFGASYLLFHEGLAWVRPATAFRLPAFAVAATIPALTYLLGLRVFNRGAGLFAALAFYAVPRHFFNAHLAAFDVPIAAVWLWVAYLFLRAQATRGALWILCGVAFGLAIATKHNALFLPLVVTPFAIYRALQLSSDKPAARTWVIRWLQLSFACCLFMALLAVTLGDKLLGRFTLLSPQMAVLLLFAGGTAVLLWRLFHEDAETFFALAPIGAMALLGPLVFYVHWPYLWHHPVERTAAWLNFHAQHEHYTWFYLGKLLRQPPFPLDYVVVKTALTVPTSLFVPMALGILTLLGRTALSLWPRLARRIRPPGYAELFVGANALLSVALISHPNVPHFGGVKHWLPSMPFLALFGGLVVMRCAGWATAALVQLRVAQMSQGTLRVVKFVPGSPSSLALLLFLLLLSPALWASVRIHPYGTSAYSELAGGLPGAASLGMQRQFWSNNVTGVLDWLNEHAPQGARIWLHEVRYESFRDYQKNGMLRSDLVPAGGAADAQIAVYQYHQEFREQEMGIWEAFGTRRPATGLYLDETPQIVVYQR